MDTMRPYLVIPKLIEQPTWGGDYIIKTKRWENKTDFANLRIGQAYEIYNGSNLSLLTSSDDPNFSGEVTSSGSVNDRTTPLESVALIDLITQNPKQTLGAINQQRYGTFMHLLIKFTQAKGNSFQLHIKDGTKHPNWKPKPESWYFFEPGFVTLGVKPFTDWAQYQKAVTDLEAQVLEIGKQVADKTLEYTEAKNRISELKATYNPWQFVNSFYPEPEALIDLSACGIHHSWEEDAEKFPLGNVVYELQLDVLDNVSTIRNFDKGKMAADGSTRPLQIADYFEQIDRSQKANLPQTHIMQPQRIADTNDYSLERLLQTSYYTLEKLIFKATGNFGKQISEFNHLFVKEGVVEVVAGNTMITVSTGHSAFIPAGAINYQIRAKLPRSVVLISF